VRAATIREVDKQHHDSQPSGYCAARHRDELESSGGGDGAEHGAVVHAVAIVGGVREADDAEVLLEREADGLTGAQVLFVQRTNDIRGWRHAPES
jgi:hypothetical protein